MHEALFYSKEPDNKVRCGLCRHHCLIADGRRGLCKVRENRQGILYTLVYGNIIAAHADPIEKKPLFHFIPGSRTFSIATPGCNFRCLHCQNYSIAQIAPESVPNLAQHSPQEIVASAGQHGCTSIAYTYTEPTIFYEFALDTARLAKEAGLRNVFVTNGYIEEEPLALIAPCLDAANIDLKSFSANTYREVCGADLDGVLESIRAYRKYGIWIEITTLIIPGVNDEAAELEQIARFIVEAAGEETPWHVSRFHPTYRMTDRPATPAATIQLAREIGLSAGLKHVYTGNIVAPDGEDTSCPDCATTVIGRSGFTVTQNRLRRGSCPGCSRPLAGVW